MKKLSIYWVFVIATVASLSLHAHLSSPFNASADHRFSTAIATIKNSYIKPTNDLSMVNSALQGILSDLDPYSLYLNNDTFQELKIYGSGDFVGIGVELTEKDGMIKVISPIEDTPADRAGIKSGDRIVAINHKTLENDSLNQVVQKLRGEKGTIITLTVISKHRKKSRDVIIRRARIYIHSVKSRLLEKHFAYIRITHFQQTTPEKVIQSIQQLKKQSHNQLKGLILDLRNNPGGLLSASFVTADIFLDGGKLENNKLIAHLKSRRTVDNEKIFASPDDIIPNIPIVVLINHGSASGAEIVAGALQDHKRAVIMGEQSFGKASVQTVFPLDRTTGIKLTTGFYHTPIGRSIQSNGIKPDIPANSKNEKNWIKQAVDYLQTTANTA